MNLRNEKSLLSWVVLGLNVCMGCDDLNLHMACDDLNLHMGWHVMHMYVWSIVISRGFGFE
jgi:hypothetical protein